MINILSLISIVVTFLLDCYQMKSDGEEKNAGKQNRPN